MDTTPESHSVTGFVDIWEFGSGCEGSFSAPKQALLKRKRLFRLSRSGFAAVVSRLSSGRVG